MRNTARRALAAAVLTTALAAQLAPAASADETTCDATVAGAAVTSAEQTVADARAAFKAANRPLGRLVAAKRHEARAELAQSRTALRALAKEARSGSTADGRAALSAEVRAERRDVAEARNLLTFKRALLAAIKADRAAARAALVAARAELAKARAAEDACGSTGASTGQPVTPYRRNSVA